jgi:altronate hydrolase
MLPGPIAEAARSARVPCRVLGVQECGGVGATVRRGLDELQAIMGAASDCRRIPCPASGLVVGTNCGGSDAHSGITANPLLGAAGDALMRAGAGWVLAESPETCGAEHLLIGRAVSDEVGDRLAGIIAWWHRHAQAHGADVDNNPAPGNKAGGITTIYEKALGAVMKGGAAPLADVIGYAEPVRAAGLTFMDTPGMDDVSVTGLVAGGCNLIAFTTGRGSCLAFKPVPVLKIATTTALFEAMRPDMDFDAGVVASGAPAGPLAERLVARLLAVAGGEQTSGERQDLGEHTFAPWDLGPTL